MERLGAFTQGKAPHVRTRFLLAAHKLRRAGSLFLACSFLSACVQIVQPTNGQSFPFPPGPIQTQVGFRAQVCVNTFQATLDGNDVTQQFSPQPPAATLPQATFANLASGSHTLSVSVQTLQYWFLIPYCGSASDSVTFVIQSPPLPKLSFSPAGPLAISAGASSSVKVTTTPAPANATSISLTVSSASVTAPGSTSIAGGQTSSPSFSVNGVIGGSATVTAASTGFQSGTLSVTVQPTITSLSPTSGLRNTPVAINGKGFTNGSTVSFGSQSPTVTFVSSSQLKITVPSTLSFPPGSTLVHVTTNSQNSNTVSFNVLPVEVVTAVPGKNAIYSNFAVIDFTQSPPSMVKVNPPYAGQSVVTCNGSMIAVGNMSAGLTQIVLYDISNPALPKQIGAPISTGLANISAIKWNGTKILAGESFGTGQQVVLIDVSNPSSPTVGAPVNACVTVGGSTSCITGIGSVGLSGSKAVVAGTNSPNIDIMDFTNPTQPTQTLLNPNLGTGLKAALDGTLAAVGPLSLGNAFMTVALVDITQPAVVSQSPVDILGVTSIAIKGSQVVAGSANYTRVDLIDFTNRSNPSMVPFDPQLSGGWNVTRTASRLALGNNSPTNLNNISNVALFDVSGASPVTLGTLNTVFAPVGQVCISDF